ncbi:MAG TPA: DUF885 domain-containing protein, partial [Thermoanaerobaculia bacterium]|nr:DUF885 domain-containing protein [Thermoanaerobaculia bacterium]
MRPMLMLTLCLTAAAVAPPAAPAANTARATKTANTAAPLEARRKVLNDLLAEQWEYTLSHAPEFASILGDKRWNDKLSDLSQPAIDADLAQAKKFLARFAAVDTTGFPEQEVLNQSLMVRDLRQQLDNARFKGWEMPVTQISGLHLQAAQFPALLTFKTAKDYTDLSARYRQIPTAFEQTIALMRKGMADGLMPPRFLLEKVVAQADGLARQAPEDSPFAAPLKAFPQEIPGPEQARLKGEMLAAIRESVLPAYARFTAFVRDEYAPRGRTEPGMWSLPQGAERYAAAVRRSTTTDLTPEQIHQLGREQVTDIERQMLVLARQLGYADLKSLNAAVEKDPKLRAQSRQRILDLYKGYIDQMWPKLPQLFGRLPKAKLEVVPVETFREKEASDAAYDTGAPDGSRPGKVWVNTGEPESRKTITIEDTAYHEGVPGHHLQLSIAQELPTLPPFRQQGGYTAFVEGWALYSERLGKEVGFYKDPYSDYGRLQDEMLRAIRLVVDTGFHYKRWTRDQVVQFFHDHSAQDEVSVQS